MNCLPACWLAGLLLTYIDDILGVEDEPPGDARADDAAGVLVAPPEDAVG